MKTAMIIQEPEENNNERRDEKMPKKLLNVQDLQKLLNLKSATWIYERSRKNLIPGQLRMGRYLKFDQEEIIAWISELKGDSRKSG